MWATRGYRLELTTCIDGPTRGCEPRLIGYNLLSLWENPALNGKQTLKLLIRVHRLLNKAYLLKESFDQLWDYNRTGWARRLFENWRSRLQVAAAGALA